MPPQGYLDSNRDTHFLVQFLYVWHFYTLHFEESHQEGKRRFGSLIFIYAIWMKSVSTATCGCVIQRNLEIVLAKKPSESRPCFVQPMLFVCQTVCLDTGRDSGAGLNGLLIKAGFLASLCVESSGTDWHRSEERRVGKECRSR